jgi:hypothetical protein
MIKNNICKLGLSGNQLKIIAVISMTLDHIGFIIYPQYVIFRILGRISFPIFAYMISEGMYYTKNRIKYFIRVLILGIGCQLIYFLSDNGNIINVILTWAMAIFTIYLYQKAKENANPIYKMMFAVYLIALFVFCEFIPYVYVNSPYKVDYGFVGVLLPLVCYIPKNKYIKLTLLAFGMLFLVFSLEYYQYWCYLSLIFLFVYNGRKGKMNLKNFFYLYYPLHIGVIYLISLAL